MKHKYQNKKGKMSKSDFNFLRKESKFHVFLKFNKIALIL